MNHILIKNTIFRLNLQYQSVVVDPILRSDLRMLYSSRICNLCGHRIKNKAGRCASEIKIRGWLI